MLAGAAWPLRGAEDGADLGHVQPGTGPVDHSVEDPLHRRAVGEDQVAAVLELIDGQPINKSAALLLVEIQPEAQARGIDPALADLAQPPYSRILRQGICDPGQARRLGDRGKAIAGLGECYPRRGGLPGHLLVAIEDDLRAERRMPAHLDRHMTPLGVDDGEVGRWRGARLTGPFPAPSSRTTRATFTAGSSPVISWARSTGCTTSAAFTQDTQHRLGALHYAYLPICRCPVTWPPSPCERRYRLPGRA